VELVALKFLAIVVLLGLAALGGLLPLRVAKWEQADKWFSLSNAFAGGLFLSVGLIHLIGEADEGFVEAGVHDEYPFGLLLASCAFLGILLLENVVVREDAEDERVDVGSTAVAVEVDDKRDAGLRARLLVILLSVHSFIAGMAIGAETTVAATVAILIAIIAHKGPEGYALGLSLYEAGKERSELIRTVLLYSIMTPIGIVVGTLLAEVLTGEAQILAEAIFDGLAGGTFLYIATLGILKEEYAKPEYRWPKYTATALAVVLIAVVSIWA
jgi:solute carrier family 39 (zinc transporter), member 1/2/3